MTDLAGLARPTGGARAVELGGAAWGVEDIRPPPAPLRLYRASASAHCILGKKDERIAVSLG